MWDLITVLYRKRNYLTCSCNADISRAGKLTGLTAAGENGGRGQRGWQDLCLVKGSNENSFPNTEQVGRCFLRSCLIDQCPHVTMTDPLLKYEVLNWPSYEFKLSFLGARHYVSDPRYRCGGSQGAAAALWHSAWAGRRLLGCLWSAALVIFSMQKQASCVIPTQSLVCG